MWSEKITTDYIGYGYFKDFTKNKMSCNSNRYIRVLSSISLDLQSIA